MVRLSSADWISLSRIPIAVLVVLFLDNKPVAISLMILAIFTDWLDGVLAGKGTQQGAIIDPLADKLFMLIVGIAVLSKLAWYYVVLFFSRDIFTVLASGIFQGFGLKGVKARTFGKIVTVAQFVALLLVFLKSQYAEFLISVIGVLTAFAIIEYVWWFRREIAHL